MRVPLPGAASFAAPGCAMRTPIRAVADHWAAVVRQAVRVGQRDWSFGRSVSFTSRAIASSSGS